MASCWKGEGRGADSYRNCWNGSRLGFQKKAEKYCSKNKTQENMKKRRKKGECKFGR